MQKFLKKLQFFFLSSLSLIAFLFLLKSQVMAEDAFSLKVYPPVAYLAVKPGAALEHNIELFNSGQFTLRISPQLVDFHSDDKTGKVILEQKTENKYISIEGDQANWGQSFTLRPGAKKNLSLLIAVPSVDSYGEYYSSVLFQAEQVLYDSENSEGKSLISAIVASNIILLSVADGENRGELIIDNFSLPRFVDSFMGIRFSAKVKNIGFNAKLIDGYFKISHWPDSEAELYQLYPDMVLTDSRRIVRAMKESSLKELELLEDNKEVKIAAGEDFDREKEEFIQKSLNSELLYRKAFLLGTYDFELKVGDDILQKRVIALPFSLLGLFLLFPFLYFLSKLLIKKTNESNS